MWMREPGEVVDRLHFLGTHDNCLYLLRGEEAMIIGGGMSWIAPSLEEQLSMMDFDPDRLKYLVILHSHFDHCGAVPYLKRKFPRIQVIASAHAAKVLAREKVVSFIATANKQMIDRLGLQDEYERLNLSFDGIQVDRIVAEKDIIDLGDGIEVNFLETPGHTKCSVAAYVPKLKALFPSDAAPPPTEDENEVFYPGPQYDFSMYEESLKKLASCEVEICAFEHYGVVTDDQARKILRQGLNQTEAFKNRIVELYRETGGLDETVQRVGAETVKGSKFEFIDAELETIILQAVVRNALRDARLLDEAPAS